MQTLLSRYYIGIDPGERGAIAVLANGDPSIWRLENATELDTWNFLAQWIGRDCTALIEQQTARPTFVPSLGKPTILASTCHLYGNYRMLRAMLTCANYRFEDCPPKRWQQGLHIPTREKTEKDNQWKGRLKSKCQQLFPSVKVTLGNADALLIAEWCRRCALRLKEAHHVGTDTVCR